MSLGVAIVGCGLVGRKRAAALVGARLTVCSDVRRERADALASTSPGTLVASDWRGAIDRADVDVVIVATTNDALAEVAHYGLAAGKHLLVEKPAGRTLREIDSLIEAAQQHRRLVRVGFNHRYHPAIRKAREAAAAGDVEKATEYTRAASRALDKAVSKGVIHKNQAANKKSALASKVAALKG